MSPRRGPGRAPRLLWVSTSTTTQGGIATCVRTLAATGLWERWGVRHVVTHRDGSRATKALTFVRGLTRYTAEVLLRRPDLVHIHMSSAGSFVRKAALAWLAYLLRIPVVLHVHSGRFHVFHERGPAPLRRVIRATLTRADVVIALGELMRARLAVIAPEARLTSLPNPVPISPVAQRPAGAAPHVVFLGRIWAKKGAFALIEAWAKQVGVSGGHLTLAGDGEPERAREMARELGVADSVTVHDWLPADEVADLLGRADVLALPSENEGQPMVVLEAMSRGLAVLATRVGGIPELVTDAVEGLLVPPHDAGALADALGELLADEDRRRALGAAGAARARAEFAADAVAARIEGLYREVLAGRARGAAAGPVRVTLVLDVAAVGGAEIVLRDTFAHLDPARVVTDVVCLREGGPLADDFRAVSDGVTVLPRRGRLDPAGLARVPQLARHLRRRRSDVVVVSHHHRAALTLARVAARLTGRARSVVAAHDMDLTHVGSRVLPRYVVETLFLSDGLALLAPSQGRYLHDEEGVGTSWRSRVREYVVPNGIPAPAPETPQEHQARRAAVRAELDVADADVVVLMVARLSPQKAHEVMLDAFARAAHPRLRLVVVGDGKRRAELEALVAERGLGDAVTFLGLRRDVPRLLAGGDVSALSSVHEGVPISVIEAMTAGLPVVATDVGALRDLVTDGEDGFLVPPGDAAGLADRLVRLADDPDLCRSLGEHAQDRARRELTVENTAAAFTAMVESVTGRQGR